MYVSKKKYQMITVDQIEFSYGKKKIYEEFSLNLQGRVIGLIGQNGAGKTTLVHLMLGILYTKSGQIKIDNLDIRSQRNAALKLVGAMFENSEFPRWLSLFRYLSFVAQVRGLDVPTAEREAERLLKRFDLEDYKDKNFQKLSAGMKQKFGIAQAIIGYPKYIFLDEPTANLDVKARLEILEYLQEIAWEKDITVIILSHILHDLERICDRVIFINKGRLVMDSLMSDLIESDYRREYSIRFRSKEEIKEVEYRLRKLGVKISGRKGITLEFKAYKDEMDRVTSELGNLSISPTRSLLEQIFVDKIGGMGD